MIGAESCKQNPSLLNTVFFYKQAINNKYVMDMDEYKTRVKMVYKMGLVNDDLEWEKL